MDHRKDENYFIYEMRGESLNETTTRLLILLLEIIYYVLGFQIIKDAIIQVNAGVYIEDRGLS